MKKRRIVLAVAAAGLLALPVSGVAGPLDRGPMQERYNPAAKDMLRVPGVIGSYEQEALGMLQQAGLAVTVKRITKDNPKYEGKEGIVISQEPSSGGVAMVGSSVNITVYKTGQGYQQGGGGYGGNGQWGDEGGFQDDGQQDFGAPEEQDQWNGEPAGGGWTPPPPGDEEYPSEQYQEDDQPIRNDMNLDLGADVPHVPPLRGRVMPRGPIGKVVGQPIHPSSSREAPKKPSQELLTPAQKRDLQRKLDNSRSGRGLKANSSSGHAGTIVARPVHPTATKVEPVQASQELISPSQKRELKNKMDNARAGRTLHVRGSKNPTYQATPVNPTRKAVEPVRFRIVINGFKVEHQTSRGKETSGGKGDEVFIKTRIYRITRNGGVTEFMPVTSKIMGNVKKYRDRVKAGTASEKHGGLKTGDKFPVNINESGKVPGRSGEKGAPPMVVFEGASNVTTRNDVALVIIPTIWEWDKSKKTTARERWAEWNSGYLQAEFKRRMSYFFTGAGSINQRTAEYWGLKPVEYKESDLQQTRPIGIKAWDDKKGLWPYMLILYQDSHGFIRGLEHDGGERMFTIHYKEETKPVYDIVNGTSHSTDIPTGDQYGDYVLYVKVELLK